MQLLGLFAADTQNAVGWVEAHWQEIADFAILVGQALAVAALVLFALLWLRGRLGALVGGKSPHEGSWRAEAQSTIRKTSSLLILALAVYAGAAAVGYEHRLITLALLGAFLFQAGVWATSILVSLASRYAARQSGDYSTLANALSLVKLFINFAVWAVVGLTILGTLGVDVTALIAGLGVGGIAIGLAAQSIFADLFASLTIVLDRPFVRGDFIIFGDLMGTVERIGLKTTRIRALSGELIVVSNANLLQTNIRNYKQLYERRVLFRIGVVYQTPVELVEEIPKLLRAAVEGTEGTRFDRAHFAAYGDFSLNYEIVYYVQSPEYGDYMDRQQAINLKIMRDFAARGIEFAYPTQSVFVEKLAGREEPSTELTSER
ncbi:MAG: mechanosensitive ion channel family protein [Alphaproteobacteria bacterium]|nr:mechanosensitive ion channel family protein [Alphaproteobacteria bacterium]